MAVQALFDTVACMSQMSALSSVLLSPNQVRKNYTSIATNIFPIYQVSPDTTEYQPATSPVTPPIPEPPGATGSFDSLIGLDLLDQEADFSCLSAPLLVFPDDLLLIPVPDSRSTSPVYQPPRRPPASVISFLFYCTLSDTGSHPLNSQVSVPDSFIFRGGHCRHEPGLCGCHISIKGPVRRVKTVILAISVRYP